LRHALSAARASPRAADAARAAHARTSLAPTSAPASSPTRRAPRPGARRGAGADQTPAPHAEAPREGASVAGDGGAAETPSFAAVAPRDAIGSAPLSWSSPQPQPLAAQGYSPTARLSPPSGARQVNSWAPQGWLRAAARDAAPASLESPEGGAARGAAPSSSSVLVRQGRRDQLGAARALLLEGRAAAAVELVWRQLAAGEAGEAGAAAAAVELLVACEENAARLLDELGAEQAQAVVGFVAEELKAERNVPQLLPWLETALRLRMASGGAGGRDLFDHAAYKSLSRTLRGLSASADASGIHAAKLFALLQAAPAPMPPRAAWLD